MENDSFFNGFSQCTCQYVELQGGWGGGQAARRGEGPAQHSMTKQHDQLKFLLVQHTQINRTNESGTGFVHSHVVGNFQV